MDFSPQRLKVCVWGRVGSKLNKNITYLGQNGNTYKIRMYKTNGLESNFMSILEFCYE